MTVQDLIKAALRSINAIASGEPLDANEGADSLVALNSMLGSWNADRLTVRGLQSATYALTTSQQTYTIGAGGDFNAARPARVEAANVILSGNLRKPLRILNAAQWSAVRLQSVGGLPEALYYDGGYPLGSLSLLPYPSIAASLELYTWQAIAKFSALTDTIALEDGYEEALKYNLAVRLAPEFGAEVPAVVATLARETLGTMRALHAPESLQQRNDTAGLGSRMRRGFNWLTGDCA
jgi:hypothetical protein